MSVVEQRYRAVLMVESGVSVTETAIRFGVSRQSVSGWLSRYRRDGLAGLVDRSRRPESCPHQTAAEVAAVICELRREHPRWGPRRLVHELDRGGVVPVPSRMSVYRILVRHGLIEPKARRRHRRDYRRWERDEPMALWQMDIVGGVFLTDGREVKIVTGVDDHSRFCVIAAVVARATGRAVCLAFAEGMRRFGVPEEVLTDNGKQFTDRFGKGGEVLFDRICRDNGITHRLTQPASPTTTGKVERFHQTLRRELLDDHPPFPSILAAQAAVDTWVSEYNCDRPHQGLDNAYPADRFTTGQPQRQTAGELLPLHLPPSLKPVQDTAANLTPDGAESLPEAYQGGPVEFERVVPASGNLGVAGKQFWLGTARAGVTVTFWASVEVIHLLIASARVKTVRSHLSVADLAALANAGGRPAGPAPLPPSEPGPAVEVDRTVSTAGTVSLKNLQVLAAEILAGRRVTIRIDGPTLTFFDPDTRELLRTRPNPLTNQQTHTLRGARPAGPPPRPTVEPVRVQRRASNSGIVMVVGQKIALGRIHAGQTVTIHVAEHTLTIDLPDGDTRTIQRTTTQPVRRIKTHRPKTSAL
ncbi:IS481 family transposase [Actinophytocola sp. NPDC049390]|uniref:IS481 family transposase n=1 Tax=Actinophytocola sp. NPDC049390 TaxID=3363894 RepID=UPI0037BD8AF1